MYLSLKEGTPLSLHKINFFYAFNFFKHNKGIQKKVRIYHFYLIYAVYLEKHCLRFYRIVKYLKTFDTIMKMIRTNNYKNKIPKRICRIENKLKQKSNR